MKDSYPMLGRYVIPDMPSAKELLPYLQQIDENRWYSNFGPLVTQFEDRLEMHLSLPDDVAASGPLHLTTLTSCYHALQIGLQLFRLPEGAQVLMPSVTFPACPLAVRHAGAVPILADVDDTTWQLTPQIARQAASKMPIHAVMPVAIYGVPVPTDEWDQFTHDTGIPVIIDAAAALDVQQALKKGLVAYSLHATKPFSIGEGGVLVSRHPEWIEEARSISNFGTQQRVALRDGSNAKLSEYHGAVALAQLDRWHDIKKRRRDVYMRYRSILEKAKLGLQFQSGIDHAVVSTLMLRSAGPDAVSIVNALHERGIAAHRMYLPPLYHHPYFVDLTVVDVAGRVLPGMVPPEQKAILMHNSETLHHSVFGVPFHSFLHESDMAYVAHMLAEVMDQPQVKVAAR